jgi:phosphatidylglycerol:prolipoprotein diacylglycerol transferase
MIDPVIFTIRIGSFELALRWYGLLIVTGTVVGAWLAAREVRRRGENPEYVWEGLVWALVAGMVGARLWYVVNDILGGSTRYLEDPVSIVRITEGGLHFYGAILFGLIAVLIFARRRKLDMWLILDSVAPSLLIGQAIARPANFINQELYGPPTDLPWGIPISADHRLPPWHDLSLYPEETTRFHPTFAYEMIWNLLAAGLLLWISHRFYKKLKPGALFAAWMILAGLGRFVIEGFRPDQPRVPGTDISYSRIVAGLLTLGGVVMLLIKYEVIRIPFIPSGPDSYTIAPEEDSQSVSPNSGKAPETKD